MQQQKIQTKLYRSSEFSQMFTYNDSSLKDRILGDLNDGNFKRIEMHGTGNRELFVIDRI